MINNTLTSVLNSDDLGAIRVGDLSTSTNSSPLIVKGDYSYAGTSTMWSSQNYYCTTALQSPKFYSSEELLSKIKSIFDSYGFEFTYNSNDDNNVVNNNSLSEKETSSDILGWVAVGFLENKNYYSSFQLWLRFATNNELSPIAITLIVKEGSYFENFSVKILLENNLVLIDSTSGIVHIIQEMLLENLQKAVDEIMDGLGQLGQMISSGYGYGGGISVSADTIFSVNNCGVSN